MIKHPAEPGMRAESKGLIVILIARYAIATRNSLP